MVFWIIEYGPDKLSGWQIMNADMSNPVLYDDAGNILIGGFDYSFVAVSDTPPSWWVG